MPVDKTRAIIEAILLLEVEPVEETALSRLSGLSPKEVSTSLENLVQCYSKEEFGIIPIRIAGGWTFSPKEYLWENLKTHYGKQRNDKLSRAALETLAIVAYSQPLTRTEIENIRGVNVDSMIRTLKEKKLIKELGRKDTLGRPMLYGTTREFLKIFRLESISALPKLDEKEQERFSLYDTE